MQITAVSVLLSQMQMQTRQFHTKREDCSELLVRRMLVVVQTAKPQILVIKVIKVEYVVQITTFELFVSAHGRVVSEML